MYISIDWLKDFIKIPAKIKPSDIASELTKRTVEVENIIDQSARFSQVVVGHVLSVDPHPNADRLRLVKVDVGSKKLDIVCGAPNVAANQVVPVALVGATLPSGLEIKKAEIRGVESNGMICAEDELGLGGDHEGIMVLKSGTKAGLSFARYLKAEDYTLEVDNKSLSNRPDLLSHYGIARELGVIFDLPLKPYSKFLVKLDFPTEKDEMSIKVEDRDLCNRYQAVRLENVNIKESPDWLKNRLIAVGQRPINNIVDLTNYVMLETGQPLHAFDAGKINRLSVRRAKKNEMITLLDGQDYKLDEKDLVIASDSGPVALAGIMGGLESSVNIETKDIILESANFQAATIRRTAQKLGLRSESSVRFEKSLDPQLTEIAIRRFVTLLKKDCPALKISSGLLDISNESKKAPVILDLNFNWLDKKIGQEISHSSVINILERLGFVVEEKDEEVIKILVPSWRSTKDIQIIEDVAEEILRFYGYDNIESKMPVQKLVLPEQNYNRSLARKIKNLLFLKHALSEVYNYSFVGEDLLTKLDIDFSHHLRIANPLSELHSLLRRSLAPNLIVNIRNNQSKSEQLAFFEFGSVFSPVSGSLAKEKSSDETLPYQEQRLAIVLADDKEDIFGRAKGIVTSLLNEIIGKDKEIDFSVLIDAPAWAKPSTCAKIMVHSHEVGLVAAVNERVASNMNLKKATVVVEFNFDLLTDLVRVMGQMRWREANKYPALRRDIAIVVSDKILYNDLRKEISGFDPLIVLVELFDVYSGSKLPQGEKSLAFHLEYQSSNKTLTAAEVDIKEKDLLTHLNSRFDARLREF